MGLKARLDSLDGVPEALRSLYTKGDDGKFTLAVDDAEDVFAAGLKGNNARLLEEKRQTLEKLKTFEGIDPEEVKRLKAEKAERDAEKERAEAEKQKATGDWAAREAALKQAAQRELEAIKAEAKKETDAAMQRAEKQSGFIRRILVENKVRETFGPLLVAPETADVMVDHLAKTIRVVEDGEAWRAEVVDEKGQPRIRGSQGEPFTIADLAKEMSGQEKYAGLFKGTGQQGSGSRGSGVQQNGKKTIRASDRAAFAANIDGIAKGEVVVVEG